MPAKITNFPLVAVSDILISFLQYCFGNENITPSDFRWNQDDRATKIHIGGPFTITRDKVGAMPTITVNRGNFSFQNKVMDNFESADPITFENPQYRDLMNGPINIICEAGAGPEATGLANFIAIEIQANRKLIAAAKPSDNTAANFIHKLNWVGIGPETPIEEEGEISRWQCTLTYACTLTYGWIKREKEPQPFNKLNIYSVDANLDPWESIYGEITEGSPYLVDNSADFGFLNTNRPQFLEREYNNKWYYVNFEETNIKKFTVAEIIDSKTLKLSVVDENGDVVDFDPDKTETGLRYKILWNSLHLNIELPKKN